MAVEKVDQKPTDNFYVKADHFRYWTEILGVKAVLPKDADDKLRKAIYKARGRAFVREFLSGITVALAQVPEAVAFAFTAGVDPLIGLQAAWIMCLLTALLGGAPGMISGATGAVAVLLPSFVKEHGVGYLFIAIMMMGVVQIIFGLIGIGRLVKLIGAPTMIGFVNGLAIVIGLAQFHSFKKECPAGEDHGDGPFQGCWLDRNTILWQVLLVAITMSVIYTLPKFTKAIPASLAGILISTAIEFALIRPIGFRTPLVEDLASVAGTFPVPIWLDDQYSSTNIPSLVQWETYRICLPLALTLSVVGLVESLLTLQLVSDITKRPGMPRKECLAQGFANVIAGMFGGMGGCAMIGQSMINVKSGGITRISSSTAGLFLLITLLVAYKAINIIPVASLTGVMFMVVIGTFDWSSLKLIVGSAMPQKVRDYKHISFHGKVKRTDVLIIIVVTVVAVLVNLAVAVASGVVLATLFFAWDQKGFFYIETTMIESESPDLGRQTHTKVYKMYGSLFFATSQDFEHFFNPRNEPASVDIVILDLINGGLCDYSAFASINKVAHEYKQIGIEFRVRNVNPKYMNIFRKARHLMFTHDRTELPHVNEEKIKEMELLEGGQGYTATSIRMQHDGEFQEEHAIENNQTHATRLARNSPDDAETISAYSGSNNEQVSKA